MDYILSQSFGHQNFWNNFFCQLFSSAVKFVVRNYCYAPDCYDVFVVLTHSTSVCICLSVCSSCVSNVSAFCSSCMCILFESVFHLPCVNASMIVDVGIIVLLDIWILSVCTLTSWNNCGIYFCTAVDGSDCWRSFTVIAYTVCSRYFGINMTADATAFSISMAVFQPDGQFPSGFLSCTLRKPSGISGAGFYEPDTQQMC